MYCTKCGNKLEGNERVCPHCGNVLSPQNNSENDKTDGVVVYCTKCGNQVEENERVCPRCGNVLSPQNNSENDKTDGVVMYCKKCGNLIADGETVCTVCGNVVSKSNPYDSNHNSTSSIKYFNPKGTAGLTLFIKICCIAKIIISIIIGSCIGVFVENALDLDGGTAIGVIVGLLLGISFVVKDLLFANIADNVNIIAKNAAENNKK